MIIITDFFPETHKTMVNSRIYIYGLIVYCVGVTFAKEISVDTYVLKIIMLMGHTPYQTDRLWKKLIFTPKDDDDDEDILNIHYIYIWIEG